jgi:hypothetical protein
MLSVSIINVMSIIIIIIMFFFSTQAGFVIGLWAVKSARN